MTTLMKTSPPPLGHDNPFGRQGIPSVVLRGMAVGAIVVGVLLTLLLGTIVGAVVVSLIFYTVVLGGLSRIVEGPRQARDRVFTVIIATAFVIAILPLVSLLYLIITNGAERFDVEFFTSDMRGVLGEGGGAFHAVVGTLLMTLLAAVISVPIGVMCAVYLVEYGRGRLATAITMMVDVMTGIPSIVAGLFAYAFFALFLGPGVSMGFAGSLALSVLMIPVVVRSVEEMLKLVPNELREASYALGIPRWRTIVKVVLPTSAAGIAAGVTIAIARVIGETAPLLIVAGSVTSTNWNLFEGKMMALPVFTYYSYIIPGVPPEFSVDRAWTAALSLMLIVMGLNLIARLIARRFGSHSRGR